MAGCWCGLPSKIQNLWSINRWLPTHLHAFNPKPTIIRFCETWGLTRTERTTSSAPASFCKTGRLSNELGLMSAHCLSGFGIQPQPYHFLPWLWFCRATRGEVPWQAEANYIAPAAEKDNLPSASEGTRLEPCPSHLLLTLYYFWKEPNSCS